MASERFSLHGFTVDALITSVYDGDTVTASFALPQYESTKEYLWPCRLLGVDAPEIRSKDPRVKQLGIQARNRVSGLVLNRVCRIYLGHFDKYGRVLVRIETPEGDLASLLLAEGLAKEYDGKGPRPEW